MALDNFSWIVLILLVVNCILTLKLLMVITANKREMSSQIKYTRQLIHTMTDLLKEFRDITQGVKEALIEIKMSVDQHRKDDEKEHNEIIDIAKRLDISMARIKTLQEQIPAAPPSPDKWGSPPEVTYDTKKR